MLHKLIKQNRTFRRFYEDIKISNEDLISFIELARLSSSPRNQQALKFYFSNTEDINKGIFKTLSWAGALPNWDAPEKGERPSAYVIILGDNSLIKEGAKAYHEVASGIVAQSITLGASKKDFGACMIAAIKRKPLREFLNLPEHLEILLVIAIGKPKETVILKEMPKNGNYNYWRDEKQNHYVPKRSLDEIIINK